MRGPVVLGHVEHVRVEQHGVAGTGHDPRNSGRSGQCRPMRIDVVRGKVLAAGDECQAALVGRQVLEKHMQLDQQIRCVGMIHAEHIGQIGMKRTGEGRPRIEQPRTGFVERQVFPHGHAQQRQQGRQIHQIDEDRIAIENARQVDIARPVSAL